MKQHLVETEEQVLRLEKVFEVLGESARGKRCPGIEGILKEGDELLANVDGRTATNAAIVAAAQAVEHYEITRYGTLIAWATELDKEEVVPLLERNLREEKAADKKLTTIAEARVNKGSSRRSRTKRRPSAKRKVSRAPIKRKRPAARRAS